MKVFIITVHNDLSQGFTGSWPMTRHYDSRISHLQVWSESLQNISKKGPTSRLHYSSPIIKGTSRNCPFAQ